MKTAIIGLPMVGKTTLFQLLTGVHESARVGAMEAKVGMTKVPDMRLEELAKVFEPKKITHATIEYLDVPPISKENLREASYLSSLRVVQGLDAHREAQRPGGVLGQTRHEHVHARLEREIEAMVVDHEPAVDALGEDLLPIEL